MKVLTRSSVLFVVLLLHTVSFSQQPSSRCDLVKSAVVARNQSVALTWAPLLCAVPAFLQAGVASSDHADQPGEDAWLMREKQISAVPTSAIFQYRADVAGTPPEGAHEEGQMFDLHPEDPPATLGDTPGEGSKNQPSLEKLQVSKPAAFNRDVYYRNKLEFSLDGGWLPINVPFPLDIFVGDTYNTYPLKYTLVPIFASLRWQIDGIEGPWILRGNWDLTFTGSVTAIPRGPESRYFSYIMGIRRNFVPRKGRIAPYFDVRLGVGNIDAKGPKGVLYAQGQDLTFTINMGSGVRYNFNPRYAISAGMNFMHISNLDLSESNGKPNWGIRNYGINVYGPMVGIDIQLRRHQGHSAQ
jgi:Lipid A 3-O-deacylase (PagL)